MFNIPLALITTPKTPPVTVLRLANNIHTFIDLDWPYYYYYYINKLIH